MEQPREYSWGISIGFVHPGIPKEPKFKRMSLWERLNSAIISSYKCGICGRAEPFVKRWHAVLENQVICDCCRDMNAEYYDCRSHWAQELWVEKCPQ